MTEIRERVAQSGTRLSTPTKQLIILGALALVLIVGFIIPVSAIVSQHMRASVDADLRHHVSVVRTILAWEGYYLRAEGRTLASFEGVDDALRTRDAGRLSHIVATIQDTHGLDAVYVVGAGGAVLVASAQHGPEPATVMKLDLVQDGLNGLNTNRSFVADDRLWLAGAAPHVTADCWVDAVFFLAREIDHDYLNRISDMLGTEIVLTDGQLVFSSLSPDDHSGFLATGWLPDSLAVDELPFQQSIIDGVAEPIMVIDTDYQVKLMNRAAREFSSVGAGVSPSLHCYQVSHQREVPCDKTAFPCPLEQVRECGQPVTVVHEHYGAHGEQRTTEVIASPLWGEDGSFQGLIECVRDITERKRAEETLQQYADRLRALTTQQIEIAEAERQRVARELHDETSQALANLIVALGTAARVTRDRETRQSLEQVKGLAVDTLEGVKRIVLDLRPRLLDDYGLMPAIRWYAEERLEQANIGVTVDVEGGETRLPPHAETGIFRVVQEAVNNIVRHAQATHAWIRLTWDPNRFAVEIEDDGRGFDVQAMVGGAKRNGCLGLLGMQERVALMDGTLEIESAPGAGTRILVQVPVPQMVEADVEDQRAVGG